MRRAISRALSLLALGALVGACDPAPIDGARCNAKEPCPSDFQCVDGLCEPVPAPPACEQDEDCVVGVCLAPYGLCVQCREAADCGTGTCLPGLYVCGCTEGAHCATGRCYVPAGAGSGHCASCYSDAQCDGGVCDRTTGICEESRRQPITD